MRPLSLILILVSLVALVAVEAGAQFVAPGGTIPVVANNPGSGGTFWRSDMSVVNVGAGDTQVILQLFPEITGGTPAFEVVTSNPIDLAAGKQLDLSNLVQSQFGMVGVKGSLRVFSNDGSPLVISSRTYTTSADGSYGQDVTGVMVAREAWASGLQHDSFYRTNIGIFYPGIDAVQFTITVYSSDGQVIGSGQISFSQAGLQQQSLDSLNVSLMTNGYLHISCSDPSVGWFAYASRVDQVSGDAVFRPARGRLVDVS